MHLHIVALVIDVQLFCVFLDLRELGALLIAELQRDLDGSLLQGRFDGGQKLHKPLPRLGGDIVGIGGGLRRRFRQLVGLVEHMQHRFILRAQAG